jgi:hypothetical protein
VAVAQGDQLDPDKLGELSEDHRREMRPSDQFSASHDD